MWNEHHCLAPGHDDPASAPPDSPPSDSRCCHATRTRLLLPALLAVFACSGLLGGARAWEESGRKPLRPPSDHSADRLREDRAAAPVLPQLTPCPLQGIGAVDAVALGPATTRSLAVFAQQAAVGEAGTVSSTATAATEIDRDTAVRLATARAHWQWGPQVRLGSVLPLHDPAGNLYAWDVDFTLDGAPLGAYMDVAEEWQAFCRERALTIETRTRRGETGLPRETGSRRYGSVTVSATLDAPPVRGCRAGVSSFYATGWKAAGVAAQVLGTAERQLVRILFTGSWERLFAFTDGTQMIFVQGHEPWGWYDAETFVQHAKEDRLARQVYTQSRLQAKGRDLAGVVVEERKRNAARIEDWLAGSMGTRSQIHIVGYAAEFIPYQWFGGCSPTSGSMVLNYYDELGWYGRITYYYSRDDDPVFGTLKCHVSDASRFMRVTMNTSDEAGRTFIWDIYPGMVEYANDYCDYNFSGGVEVAGDIVDWHFEDGVDMINGNHPFIFSSNFYPGAGTAHSVAAVGYDRGPDPDEYLCYNTWADGYVVESAPSAGGPLDYTHLAAPYPGGGSQYDVKLTSPDGHPWYSSCYPLGSFESGQSMTIQWINWGEPAHHVDIDYSPSAGAGWAEVVSGTADDGSYVWDVPCEVGDALGRIRISQYSSGSTLYSSDGSYGDFEFEDYDFPPSPTNCTPPSGVTCQPTAGTLDWDDVAEAEYYVVRITPDGEPYYEVEVVSSAYHYSGFDPGRQYAWSARCVNTCGLPGASGGLRTFTIGPASLAAPTLLSPANDATCVVTTGTLDWSDVTDAGGYRIQLGWTCGGYSPVIQLTASQLDYNDLDPGRTYYWRVATRDACGNYGSYSDCWRFTCGSGAPQSPVLLMPANGAVDQSVTGMLDWQDAEGATAYRVRIGTSCGAGSEYLISSATSEFEYYSLDPGEAYFWQVQTKDACEQWGAYSDCFQFTIRAAATILVEADGSGGYPTIQAAIDAAIGGDVVELGDGTYSGTGNRDLDFLGKAITVRSGSGDPGACIIDCGGSAAENHRGVTFQSSEGYSSVLEGVTIRYGYAYQGGGIYISASSPRILNCHIDLNTATNSGGGIYSTSIYTPIFQSCTLQLNHSSFDGGAMMIWNSDVTLTDCELLGNSAGDDGGALCLREGSEPNISGTIVAGNTANDNGGGVYSYGNVIANYSDCTISGNSAPTGGGFSLRSTSSASLRNSIVAFSPTGASTFCDATSSVTTTCTDVYGNAGGDWVGCVAGQSGINDNLAADPLFCLPENYDFELHLDSPCAAENNPDCGQIGARGIGCGPSVPLTVLVKPDGTGDYPTIQAALDDLLNGSTVELADGIFTGPGNRDIDFVAKMITVRYQRGDSSVCVIDCGGSAADPHRAFYFHYAEGSQTRVERVTIRNGYAEDLGGAIYCVHLSSPAIIGCVFEDNVSDGIAGAIACDYSSCPTIQGCRFENNHAVTWGGAIDLWRNSSPTISDCAFIGNTTGAGGAIDAYSDSSPSIVRCTFIGNEAVRGGALFAEETLLNPCDCSFYANSAPPQSRKAALPGEDFEAIISGRVWSGGVRSAGGAVIYAYAGATVTLERSILAFSALGEAVLCEGDGSATLSCCDVYGNAGGDWVGCLAGQEGANDNLWADPRFCTPAAGALTLQEASPCTQQANPGCGRIGACEIGCGYHLTINAEGTGDYSTIQAAIDAAGSWDVIELLDGTYTGSGNRDLDYQGKVVTVCSASGNPTDCVIDCEGSVSETHYGVYFHTGETADCRLENVTITGGYTGAGGAVKINNAAPTIVGCIFTENHATDSGGAIQNYQGNPTIANCLIEGNTADNAGGGMNANGATGMLSGCTFRGNWALWGGGGLYNYHSSPLIDDCIFDGNTCDHWGGGLHNTQIDSQPTVVGCTFHGNGAPAGSGIYNRVDAQVAIENTTIAFGTEGEAVYCGGESTAILTCSDVYGNAGGDWSGYLAGQEALRDNFSADPLFCDAAAGNLWLHADSPCAEGNHPACGRVGALGVGCGASDVGADAILPEALSLGPGTPNPCRRGAEFTLAVPADPGGVRVALCVYDASGRRVRNLPDGPMAPGIHRLTWDGTNDAGEPARRGIYFVRMEGAAGGMTRRVVLIQ